MIRILRTHPLRHKQPMLLLDADADEEVLSAVGCDVRAVHDLCLRPHADVRQLHDRRMTTGTLLDSPNLREDWRKIIAQEVLRDRLSRNAGVLVGATRKVVRAFFEDAGHSFGGLTEGQVTQHMLETRLHGAHWTWFGGRSLGSNRYAECSCVIVIGREELPVQVLEDQARALFGDTPGEPLQLLANDPSAECRLPQTEVQYEMKDGRARAVLVPCHPDPRIRRLQRQVRELATRQLIERLRLARADYPKRVLVGSNIPIPGVPVDALLAWEELCPDRVSAAVTDSLLRDGGINLTPRGLNQAAPHVFVSVEAAKRFLIRNGGSVGLPAKIAREFPYQDLHFLTLRRAERSAREEDVVVMAQDSASAKVKAEALFGPLKSVVAIGGA